MSWWRWLPFGRVPAVGAEELARRLAGPRPPLVLDVRTAAEVASGTIPGARHVPVHELARRIDELGLAPGAEVVAVCASGHRSKPAVRLLRARGLDARELAGGMSAWRRAGLPVARPAAAGS
ncbi:MAG: rhodanese-like domain-containing protein [Geminicoccaceae bacterium]|nr:rhodanese-like domain-containing protein [Geminicoccaceae bacterium]MCS7268000.1 rhodanese-like domain-containing protein [Geminicoccaceae bacterium]MDW8124086.1 rhodanese-like domain-containing protein [Geminicoccaceae bacterium]MDW8340251.1 rhodanese-like domain-containing protein [Geminicoccaceae bacterium]